MSGPLAVLTELECTGWTCPSQWDGRDAEGRLYYVRYRWGWLTVSRGREPGDDPIAFATSVALYGETVGGPWDGTMDTETMLRHTGLRVEEA